MAGNIVASLRTILGGEIHEYTSLVEDTRRHAWERTRERFVDDETGKLLEVWVDPLTGERRYEPVQDHLIGD